MTPRRHRVVVLPRRDLLRVEMSTEHFRDATTFDVSSDAHTEARGGDANEYVDEVRLSR